MSTNAVAQAVGMLAPGGTMSLVGLPPGEFPLPIFDFVLNRKTVRGSIVGIRADLAESLAFAEDGKVTSHIHMEGVIEAPVHRRAGARYPGEAGG